MKKKNIILFLISALFISVVFYGCKPTEKGYKAAYDAALNKRIKQEQDFDGNVAIGKIQLPDGPQLRTINGHEIYFLGENIVPLPQTLVQIYNYNVAVGCFKMPTNCVALAEDLHNEGYESFAAKSVDEKYYTIVASFPTLDEAIDFSVKYNESNKRSYVGLPEAPVIIFTKI